MTPQLVGDWIVLGENRYSLHPDGACVVALGPGRDVRRGTWRALGPDAFEITVHHPGFPGSGHGPAGGHDEVTYFQVLHHAPGRLLVEGREGGADGLVYDAVEWHREPFFHS